MGDAPDVEPHPTDTSATRITDGWNGKRSIELHYTQ
jgi:hypothetical protein